MMTPTRRGSGNRQAWRAVTCALVGRDRLFLDVLGGMLRLRRGLKLVAEAIGVEDGMAACQELGPDLVMIDVEGLGDPGLRLARLVRDRRGAPALFLIVPCAAGFQPPRWLADAPHAVAGKNEGFGVFLARLERLCRDRLPPATPADPPPRRHQPLTNRETEVVALIGEGLTSKEIARRLGLSPLTVQTHRKRISEKLGRLGAGLAGRSMSHRREYFESR